ncbi:MAG: hypothetical protein FWG66_12120, partial [Spirochaetes bacterium]|nr:hypothetical protein [Spirochaetota bacterium]
MRREYYLHTRKNGIFYVEFVCPESGAKMTARSTGEKDEIKARVKAERLDVNCRIDDGTQVDLEMQDRLVKALRLEGISTIEKANRYLLETYLPKMNEQFSRPARDKDDAHVSPGKAKLDDILCMEFDRVISKDYIVRFQT